MLQIQLIRQLEIVWQILIVGDGNVLQIFIKIIQIVAICLHLENVLLILRQNTITTDSYICSFDCFNIMIAIIQ